VIENGGTQIIGSQIVLTNRAGTDPTVITIQDGGGYTISRGDKTIILNDSADDVATARQKKAEARQLIGSQAVQAFRTSMAKIEREVKDEQIVLDTDPFRYYGIVSPGLQDAAIIAEIGGDRMAVTHARDHLLNMVRRRQQRAGKYMAVGLIKASFESPRTGRGRLLKAQFRDCVAEYEQFLMRLDAKHRECLQSANSNYNTYWMSAGMRFACEMEFTVGTQVAVWQFIACAAIPAK
jgi:hypothetical protein